MVRREHLAIGAAVATLEVNVIIMELFFSKEGLSLEIDRELLSIQSLYTGAFSLQPQPLQNICNSVLGRSRCRKLSLTPFYVIIKRHISYSKEYSPVRTCIYIY
jgi:hypothetical protein